MNRIWHLPKPGSYKSKLFKLTGPIFIENLLIMLLGVGLLSKHFTEVFVVLKFF